MKNLQLELNSRKTKIEKLSNVLDLRFNGKRPEKRQKDIGILVSKSTGICDPQYIDDHRERRSWITAFLKRRHSIHKFQASTSSKTFFLDANGEDYVMSAYSTGVRRNDIISIEDASDCVSYQVLEIDYYSDPPDLWTAQLKRVVE